MKRATGKRFGPQWPTFLVVGPVALGNCNEGLNPQKSLAWEAARKTAGSTKRFELISDASRTSQRDVEPEFSNWRGIEFE